MFESAENDMSVRESGRREETDPIFIPPDLYTRNKIISSVVEILKKNLGLERLRILDVGGRGGRLGEFLPSSEEILVVDLRPPASEQGEYLVGNITKAPFADEKFHVVIASELLEHIEPKSREKALAEMLRVSSHYIILGSPFRSPEVARAEALVNELHLSLQGYDHPWLKEHIENGLPDEEELVSYLRDSKTGFQRIATNNLLNWLLLQSFLLLTSTSDVSKRDVDSAVQFYNSNYEELGDGVEPTYRKIFVISKKSTVPENITYGTKFNLLKFEELIGRIFGSMAYADALDSPGAISRLMGLYKTREDLQRAYPEAALGKIENLVSWAANTVLRRHDDVARGDLKPHAIWYVRTAYEQELKTVHERAMHLEDFKSKLENDLRSLKEQLEDQIQLKDKLVEDLDIEVKGLAGSLATAVSERETLRSRLKYEELELEGLRSELQAVQRQVAHLEGSKSELESSLSSKTKELETRTSELENVRSELGTLNQHAGILEKELDRLKSRFATIASEREALNSKLRFTQADLNEIRRSFGYKLMRFYASIIDRILPDNTRRGELRRIVVRSLMIATDEGIVSLLHQAWEKISRREFTITRHDLVPTQKVSTIAPDVEERRDFRDLQKSQVLVYSDYPDLSSKTVAKVSDSFMLTGWAISQEGIREIRVYLDDVFLGLATYPISRPDVGAALPEMPDSHMSGFSKMVSIPHDYRSSPHALRVIAEGSNGLSAAVEGTIEVSEGTRIEALPSEETGDKTRPVLAKTSVVILTKSPPSEFDQSLNRIRGQDLSSVPRIVVINSGEKDLSNLVETYQVELLKIDPAEFSHGRTRNYGAQQATGDYIVFMTDDAIPANRHLLSDMISVLQSDDRVAAVTARQIPRSDADLMACYAIWGYYRMLALDGDRIVGSTDFDGLAPVEKRRICQIDDVCSCFRRDVFLKYKYDADISSAEDLELGVRLVRDGFKIAHLFSTGVVHSHNRPPSFHLKRTYVDVKILTELLHDESTSFRTPDGKAPSLNDLLDCALDLYDRLSFALDELSEYGFHKGDIPMTFQTIAKRLAGTKDRGTPKAGNLDLSSILNEVTAIVNHKRRYSLRSNPMSLGYLASLSGFQQWISSTHQSIVGIESEFRETTYKLLGAEIGRTWGSCYGSLRADKLEPVFTHLDRFLSEGV